MSLAHYCTVLGVATFLEIPLQGSERTRMEPGNFYFPAKIGVRAECVTFPVYKVSVIISFLTPHKVVVKMNYIF